MATEQKKRELSPEVFAQFQEDLLSHPVRKLNTEEKLRYTAAVDAAVRMVPAFRDVIALIRPYMNATIDTAATDEHSRVALSYWFFHELNVDQRASVLLHETMHVLNKHFQRRLEISGLKDYPLIFNYAGDFEINTVLKRVSFVDLTDVAVYPDRQPFNYPPMQTMEFYAERLLAQAEQQRQQCPVHGDHADAQESSENDQSSGASSSNENSEFGDDESQQGSSSSSEEQENDGESGESGDGAGDSGTKQCTCGRGDGHPSHGHGSGSGTPCQELSEEMQAEADAAGIQRASEVEQSIARANTTTRIMEERENSKARGLGAMNDVWDAILQHLLPKQVDWRKLFRSVLSQSTAAIIRGRQNYTYRRVSRRLTGGEFVFPGMVNYLPKIFLAIDTSGSMGYEDYQRALTEIEAIVREVAKGKDSVKIFSVDTKVGNIQPVSSTKKISLTGGGGTQMAKAWRYIAETIKANERPDVLILSTDGYIDWDDVEKEVNNAHFRSIILVTQLGGFQQAPESLKRKIPIICIDENSK